MKLALVTARTATLVTLFQTTQPLPWSAKEFEPMQWTRPTQKLFGRKAKRWSESRFNGCYVARKENHQKGSAGSEEKHNDETDETRRHLHTSRRHKQPAPHGLRRDATCRPWSLGASTGR